MPSFADHEFDPELVTRLRRGDRDAARALYDVLATPVFTLAVRILGDRHAAAEAAQETFVDVIEKVHTLHNDAALGAWVRRIAVNHCLARLRSPWYRRRREFADREAPAPGSHSDRLDNARDLDAALARLSAEARFVVWMHDVEGYTHHEIATALGKTVSFSKSQLARAHGRLADFLDDDKLNDDKRRKQPYGNGTHR